MGFTGVGYAAIANSEVYNLSKITQTFECR
jgi:hypothetical protein